jgi:hypothetical protein
VLQQRTAAAQARADADADALEAEAEEEFLLLDDVITEVGSPIVVTSGPLTDCRNRFASNAHFDEQHTKLCD